MWDSSDNKHHEIPSNNTTAGENYRTEIAFALLREYQRSLKSNKNKNFTDRQLYLCGVVERVCMRTVRSSSQIDQNHYRGIRR